MPNRPQFPRKHPPPDAAAIRALREGAEWSIAQAADLCCVAVSSWRKWEDGVIMPAPVWKLFKMLVEMKKQITTNKPP